MTRNPTGAALLQAAFGLWREESIKLPPSQAGRTASRQRGSRSRAPARGDEGFPLRPPHAREENEATLVLAVERRECLKGVLAPVFRPAGD